MFRSLPSRLRHSCFCVVTTVVRAFQSVEALFLLKYLKTISLFFLTDSFADVFVVDAVQQSLTVDYSLVVVDWYR